MSLLLISDLHLSPSRPAITQAFYSFLATTAQTAEALYILGDLFEVWLGDDDDTLMYQEVIQHLADYASAGKSLYFMHGNRDFLVGDKFANRAELTLLPDPTLIQYAQHAYLLMHGDSLCTRDADFMAFRAMSRSSQWQTDFLKLPLHERKAYAEKVRATSQTMNSNKAEDIMDVTPEDVTRIMSEHKVTTLIHGHTHRPAVHHIQLENNIQGQRLVLGDWNSDVWYVQIDAEGCGLKSYSI